MAKKYEKRKLEYINKVEYFLFKEKYQMIKIPTKVNSSGYGEPMCMGVPKAKAILDNVIALRRFVNEHQDELRTIPEDAHLKQQKGE